MKPTPIQALMQRAQTQPDATAFTFQEQNWTYGRLGLEVEMLVRGMAARGGEGRRSSCPSHVEPPRNSLWPITPAFTWAL
jgi:non-ribosomal peptide synthetase component F